jgi:hypothetical protein
MLSGPRKETIQEELDIKMSYVSNLKNQAHQILLNKKRLQRAGHVQRMEGKRIPKRILESNIIGKRSVGKPRKGRVNAEEIDSREILRMRNWIREHLERQVLWRRHLKEAKARLRAVAPWKIYLFFVTKILI